MKEPEGRVSRIIPRRSEVEHPFGCFWALGVWGLGRLGSLASGRLGR